MRVGEAFSSLGGSALLRRVGLFPPGDQEIPEVVQAAMSESAQHMYVAG